MAEHPCCGCRHAHNDFCNWAFSIGRVPAWLGTWPIDWDDDDFRCDLSPHEDDADV